MVDLKGTVRPFCEQLLKLLFVTVSVVISLFMFSVFLIKEKEHASSPLPCGVLQAGRIDRVQLCTIGTGQIKKTKGMAEKKHMLGFQTLEFYEGTMLLVIGTLFEFVH